MKPRLSTGVDSARWARIAGCFASSRTPAAATIRYRVSLAHSDQHLFQVEMDIPESPLAPKLPCPRGTLSIKCATSPIAFAICKCGTARPAPGGTALVGSAAARQADLANRASPSRTGGIRGRRGDLVRYSIEWDDPGPFNSQLNRASRLYQSRRNSDVYSRPARRRRRSPIRGPSGRLEDRRRIARRHRHQCRFAAESYDALVDAPVEAGKFSEFCLRQSRARTFAWSSTAPIGTKAAWKIISGASLRTNCG